MREIIELIKHKIKHILTPHCDECIALEEEKWKREHTCNNCENLLMLLEQLRSDYKDLLDKTMNPPKQVDNRPEHEYQPVQRAMPWRIRRHMMEVNDRKNAAALKREKQSTEELEEELGVKDAN